MNKALRRIHILGGPGSGKTFLAKILSEMTGIAPTDLDELFWDNTASDYNTRRSPDERDCLLKELVDEDQWIVEGVYHAWVVESFEKADMIIILCTPVWLRHWRILRRFVLGKLNCADHLRRETLAGQWALLKWNHAYEKDNLRRTREHLKPFSSKVREFSSAAKALRLLGYSNRLARTLTPM